MLLNETCKIYFYKSLQNISSPVVDICPLYVSYFISQAFTSSSQSNPSLPFLLLLQSLPFNLIYFQNLPPTSPPFCHILSYSLPELNRIFTLNRILLFDHTKYQQQADAVPLIMIDQQSSIHNSEHCEHVRTDFMLGSVFKFNKTGKFSN